MTGNFKVRFNRDPKRGAFVVLSVCLRIAMSQSGTAEKCSMGYRVEKFYKTREKRKGSRVILLHMKPVLLYFKIPNDIASIHY